MSILSTKPLLVLVALAFTALPIDRVFAQSADILAFVATDQTLQAGQRFQARLRADFRGVVTAVNDTRKGQYVTIEGSLVGNFRNGQPFRSVGPVVMSFGGTSKGGGTNVFRLERDAQGRLEARVTVQVISIVPDGSARFSARGTITRLEAITQFGEAALKKGRWKNELEMVAGSVEPNNI